MKLDALRSPRYRRFWFGSIGSTGASQLYFVGLSWLVFEMTGSAAYLGLLGFSMAVPTIVATLMGGLLADRANRGRILLLTSILAGLCLSFLTILDLTESAQIWQVLILAAFLGLISGFDLPARIAFFPSLIESSQMMSAVALSSILWQGTRMILPAIGGLLIALVDTWLLFFLCSIGFGVMGWILIGLQTPDKPDPPEGQDQSLGAAITFIRREKLFLVLISITWISMFFGTSYVQIMPVFAELLEAGEKGYGYLISATGVGSVCGTLIIGRFQHSPLLGRYMMGGAVLFALSLVFFAAVTGLLEGGPVAFYAACGCAILGGIGGSCFLISSMTVLQIAVPDPLRGRVMGIHSITFSLIALGGLVLGPIAELLSAPTAVLFGAITLIISLIGFSVRFPNLWRLNAQNSDYKI
ncbi:MAG: MFS transporter [Proteobacteria bacterium]|nr:MFS transporter [Pseudomonadota bacterium]